MEKIALNCNETTSPCKAALHWEEDKTLLPQRIRAIYDLMGAEPGNEEEEESGKSSSYGGEARAKARFVFTSSGAEAINQVLFSVFLEVARKEGKCHFVTSMLEDASTLQMFKRLEELGCFVKIAPLSRQGEIDLEQLAALITPRTALLSLSMAQGLTGVIQPFEEIARLAKDKGVLLHLDATHAIGKFYFSMDCDYLTFSGDRIHSVPASGGILAKPKAPLVPLILGEHPDLWQDSCSQTADLQKHLRAGALDLFSLLALGAAAQQASLYLDAMSLEVTRLRDLLEHELVQRCPGAKPLFLSSLRLPHTTAIVFPRVHAEALHDLLQGKVETSLGGRGSPSLASLLRASGIAEREAECALSFALSRMITEEEVRQAADVISQGVQTLQMTSQSIFYEVHSASAEKFSRAGSRQSPGIETVEEGGSMEEIQPPSSTTQSRELSRQPSPQKLFSRSTKKLRDKVERLRCVGVFTRGEAEAKQMRLVCGQKGTFQLYWLVDPSDGVIADAKFQAFGPLALIAVGEIVSELALRKTYVQVSRLTADLIDQQVRDKPRVAAFPKEALSFLNQALEAIDAAVAQCSDLPYASSSYERTPIAWDMEGLTQEKIEDWEKLSIDQRLLLIEEVLDKEIRPYIELDAGGVKLLGLDEKGTLRLSYQGTCTTCHSATGSTLSAIQGVLQGRLHPSLNVIPDF